MLRAVRFSSQLGFTIDPDTWTAIEREAHRVQQLSSERIRDELLRLLETDRAGEGLWVLHELGLMRYCLPELQGTFRMAQGKPGAPTLLAHLIQTVDACPPDPVLRLAALFHDVGKLTTRAVTPEGRVIFHGHEKASAEVALRCRRLRMPKRETCRIVEPVRMHMVFGEEVGRESGAALRRQTAKTGCDHFAAPGGSRSRAAAIPVTIPLPTGSSGCWTKWSRAFGVHVRTLPSAAAVMAATASHPVRKVGEVLQRLLERC